MNKILYIRFGFYGDLYNNSKKNYEICVIKENNEKISKYFGENVELANFIYEEVRNFIYNKPQYAYSQIT
jgi:hypothetical protein